MKKGFSATTFVLVAVLMGALLMVGRTVIPPPPGPPQPPPSEMAKPGEQAVPKKDGPDAMMRAEQMKKMQQQEKEARAHMPKPTGKKKFDPNQIEIKSAWNLDKKPGDEGNKEMAEMVAKAKADQAAARASGHVVTPTPGVKMAQ